MTAPKQNWVQIPGILFANIQEVSDLPLEDFQKIVDDGCKATFNLNDVFGFDGEGDRTMVFLNRLNPIVGVLGIPLEKFSSIFFEDNITPAVD